MLYLDRAVLPSHVARPNFNHGWFASCLQHQGASGAAGQQARNPAGKLAFRLGVFQGQRCRCVRRGFERVGRTYAGGGEVCQNSSGSHACLTRACVCLQVVEREAREVAQKFGNPRRTVIIGEKVREGMVVVARALACKCGSARPKSQVEAVSQPSEHESKGVLQTLLLCMAQPPHVPTLPHAPTTCPSCPHHRRRLGQVLRQRHLQQRVQRRPRPVMCWSCPGALAHGLA